MPEVSFRHDRRQIIIAAAAVDPNDPSRFHRLNALLDTGATMSGLRREIADLLSLPRQGKMVITTPSGDHATRLYRVRIGLYPSGEHPYVLPDAYLAIQCSPGEAFDMLIGMDVIGRCDLQILSNGSGTLSFPAA